MRDFLKLIYSIFILLGLFVIVAVIVIILAIPYGLLCIIIKYFDKPGRYYEPGSEYHHLSD